MKKANHKQPVLPAEHTQEEDHLRRYADKVNPLAELIKKSKSRKESQVASHLKQKLRDVRLPMAGAVLEKKYKGQEISVKVLEVGFEYNGQIL